MNQAAMREMKNQAAMREMKNQAAMREMKKRRNKMTDFVACS
jgi:hypothetical protein